MVLEGLVMVSTPVQQFMPIEAAARVLEVQEWSIWKLIQSENIEFHRQGHLVLVDRFRLFKAANQAKQGRYRRK